MMESAHEAMAAQRNEANARDLDPRLAELADAIANLHERGATIEADQARLAMSRAWREKARAARDSIERTRSQARELAQPSK
jgi:DNA repair exonuclease SbcCD ATPase subunit